MGSSPTTGFSCLFQKGKVHPMHKMHLQAFQNLHKLCGFPQYHKLFDVFSHFQLKTSSVSVRKRKASKQLFIPWSLMHYFKKQSKDISLLCVLISSSHHSTAILIGKARGTSQFYSPQKLYYEAETLKGIPGERTGYKCNE